MKKKKEIPYYLQEKRKELIYELCKLGYTLSMVASIFGITRGYVHQVFNQMKELDTKEKQKEAYEYRKKLYPEKILARYMLNNAIKSGEITRPEKCVNCGGLKPDAHHPDYSKPFEVIWLCKKCHKQCHLKINQEELLNKK